ncbi:MAG TPA: hypothetical protein VH678_25325 [Xanthobacteraceae bacterium]
MKQYAVLEDDELISVISAPSWEAAEKTVKNMRVPNLTFREATSEDIRIYEFLEAALDGEEEGTKH